MPLAQLKPNNAEHHCMLIMYYFLNTML